VSRPKRPPTFRGSDFAMRYEQGRWSEDRIIAAINKSARFRAIPYGRSQVGPKDKATIEEYWERYSQIEGVGKRPDILILTRADFEEIGGQLMGGDPLKPRLEGIEDPTLTSDDKLQHVLERAIAAIEAENSLWRARRMPDFGRFPVTRAKFVAPTIIVKAEDTGRLLAWEKHYVIPVCVVQVFYDLSFIVTLRQIVEGVYQVEASLSGEALPTLGIAPVDDRTRKREAQRVQREKGVFISEQRFTDSRTGRALSKMLYRIHHCVAIPFGELDLNDQPTPKPEVVEEPNGKLIPYVAFKGGSLILDPAAEALFDKLASEKQGKIPS